MNRRGFLGGLLTLAAPAIIRTPGLLMPVRPLAFSTADMTVIATETWGEPLFSMAHPVTDMSLGERLHRVLWTGVRGYGPWVYQLPPDVIEAVLIEVSE